MQRKKIITQRRKDAKKQVEACDDKAAVRASMENEFKSLRLCAFA
jgi:hypothetical protein